MSSARDDTLAHVQAATEDTQEKGPAKDVPITWACNQPTPLDGVFDALVENILNYKAKVVCTPATAIGGAIIAVLKGLDAQTTVMPGGTLMVWVNTVTAGGLEVIRDENPSHQQLNSIDAAFTGSRVPMAEMGAIYLDHVEDQGQRALALVSDRHVCMVTVNSVVSDVLEAVHRLKASIQAGRPITRTSGGSATSNIESSHVKGVYGPRKLFMILEEDWRPGTRPPDTEPGDGAGTGWPLVQRMRTAPPIANLVYREQRNQGSGHR